MNVDARPAASPGAGGLPAPDLRGYTVAQVRFAASAWPLRAAEELRSALIYRALARAAEAARLPAPWPERLRAVVGEELGHARLCARIGTRLGAPPPVYDPRPFIERVAALGDPRHRTAALLLAEVAMGETISMALFRAGRRAAIEPLTRAALESILRDEVRHQRLGWTCITALWPMLDGPARETLQVEATRALAASEQQIAVPALRRLDVGAPFDPAHAALGVLSPLDRVTAYYEAVERLVVPRLSRLGLDGLGAWHGRYRTKAA